MIDGALEVGMKYKVLLFASLKEHVGGDAWECESDQALTGKALMERFFEKHPSMEGLRLVTRLAVNMQFCGLEHPLNADDEIAMIPPVSGG